ncbi:hypothetical protein [Parashewanella tropica]|uniref:hypothetical protein n=1 Tax=Parashewanella tropica TaxID=2547970 RepID=UPI00105A617C|nr:hypothetical protein [Parashewanella tropica]
MLSESLKKKILSTYFACNSKLKNEDYLENIIALPLLHATEYLCESETAKLKFFFDANKPIKIAVDIKSNINQKDLFAALDNAMSNDRLFMREMNITEIIYNIDRTFSFVFSRLPESELMKKDEIERVIDPVEFLKLISNFSLDYYLSGADIEHIDLKWFIR